MTDAAAPPAGRLPSALTAAGLAVVAVLTLAFPSDAPWINDEPRLIEAAADANARAALADRGLYGNTGLPYGPFPVWCYQALLAVTRNPVAWVAIHAFVLLAVTAFALVWLARSLALPTWLAPLVLLSPWLWFYTRVLWDNSLPQGALALAAFAALARRPSPWLFGLVALLGATMLLTHPMSIAFVAPLLACTVAFYRSEIRRAWPHLSTIAILSALVAWPYVALLVRHRASGVAASGSAMAWIFPFKGGLLLSAVGLEELFGRYWQGGAPFVISAGWISAVAFPLTWAGIVLGAVQLARSKGRPFGPLERVLALSLATLLAQIALNGLTGRHGHAHYFFGTWMVFVVFAWYALSRLPRLACHATAAVWAVALLVVLSHAVVRIKTNGGFRERYGPTIGNQWEVAQGLTDGPVSFEPPLRMDHPHSIEVLRRFGGPCPPGPGPSTIRYAGPAPEARIERKP